MTVVSVEDRVCANCGRRGHIVAGDLFTPGPRIAWLGCLATTPTTSKWCSTCLKAPLPPEQEPKP